MLSTIKMKKYLVKDCHMSLDGSFAQWHVCEGGVCSDGFTNRPCPKAPRFLGSCATPFYVDSFLTKNLRNCAEPQRHNSLWNERKCKRPDSYQYSNNTIIFLLCNVKMAILLFIGVLQCLAHRRIQGGLSGHGLLQIFRKCSHFVPWEAFYQTK